MLTQAASHSPVSVSEARHLIVSVLVMTGSEFDQLGSDTYLATNFVNIHCIWLACDEVGEGWFKNFSLVEGYLRDVRWVKDGGTQSVLTTSP